MDSRAPLAAFVDTAVIVAFVAIGRRNHDEGSAVSGIVSTAAPFLFGLIVAWILVRINGKPVWQVPTAARAGLAIWAFTLVDGMLLRRFVFKDGTAVSFMIVAAIFLALLLGWRVAANAVWRRTATHAAAP
jgi:hypothetical protein